MRYQEHEEEVSGQLLPIHDTADAERGGGESGAAPASQDADLGEVEAASTSEPPAGAYSSGEGRRNAAAAPATPGVGERGRG